MKTISKDAAPARLGFPVKVLGQPGLKTNDTRRWQKGPHLRTSIEYLDRIFDYLARQKIEMYRISSDVAPYVTHPDYPQFHGQVSEAATDLEALGRKAREQKLRLSFHPSQYIIINSPDPALNARSALDIQSQAEILDRMGAPAEAVIVVHVGGVYGDKASALDRWAINYAALPEPARRRVALENDDVSFGPADALSLHERTGAPLIFDCHHFCCHNPEGLDLISSARRFLATWPTGVRPKMHFSSPRTQMRELRRKNKKTKRLETVLQPPLWTGHADYCDPFVFIDFVRKLSEERTFDVMLEAKVKDLALRRLRTDLQRYAPDAAAHFGLATIELPSEMEEVVLTEPPPEKGTVSVD